MNKGLEKIIETKYGDILKQKKEEPQEQANTVEERTLNDIFEQLEKLNDLLMNVKNEPVQEEQEEQEEPKE